MRKHQGRSVTAATFLFLLVVVSTTLSVPAFAGSVYRLRSGLREKGRYLETLERLRQQNVSIVNEIPQLNIVEVEGENEGTLEAVLTKSTEWKYLGENSEIRLIDPIRESETLSASAIAKNVWGLKAIHAKEAWRLSKGQNVIVAISDTGVDADHPDLAANMWVNTGESGLDASGRDKRKNGVDDDKNGYVDDVYGWDYVKNKGGGIDHHYHGTHVAGTIAARQTKKLSGVAPLASLMDVSFLSSSGSGTEINGAKSIVYAADMGAKIVNCSWGSSGQSDVIDEAIRYAQSKGVLVIAAAGNDSRNNDRSSFTPANSDVANVISVAATAGISGSRASFSNYGVHTVDLAAPGKDILSTAPTSSRTPRYQYLSGTSMATPHVSGVVALIWSQNPSWTWLDVKTRLSGSVNRTRYWQEKSISGGILDAFQALNH